MSRKLLVEKNWVNLLSIGRSAKPFRYSKQKYININNLSLAFVTYVSNIVLS